MTDDPVKVQPDRRTRARIERPPISPTVWKHPHEMPKGQHNHPHPHPRRIQYPDIGDELFPEWADLFRPDLGHLHNVRKDSQRGITMGLTVSPLNGVLSGQFPDTT